MSVQRDPDAILAAWLEDGPVRLPDATKRAIAVTTRTTQQSRRPMWVPWRFPTMNMASRFALGVVAVAVIALGGFYVLSPGGGSFGGPGPSATPAATPVVTPAASPTPTPFPFPSDLSGSLPVAPGTYVLDLPGRDGATGAPTTLRITFTMPAGWEKNATPTTLWNIGDHRRVGFFAADNLIADPCGTTGTGIEPPLGPSVDDLVAGLRGVPGLTTSAATDVTISGYDGKEVDLTVTVVPSPCNDDPPLWTPVTDPSGFPAGGDAAAPLLPGDELLRLDILDVDGSRLVVGRVNASDSASPTDMAELQAIVDLVRVERIAAAPSASPGS